jgi:hypothetical protein
MNYYLHTRHSKADPNIQADLIIILQDFRIARRGYERT